jgi:hypothetical protein
MILVMVIDDNLVDIGDDRGFGDHGDRDYDRGDAHAP